MKVAWSRNSNQRLVTRWEKSYKKLVSLRDALEASDYWNYLRALDTQRQEILEGKDTYALSSYLSAIDEALEKVNK